MVVFFYTNSLCVHATAICANVNDSVFMLLDKETVLTRPVCLRVLANNSNGPWVTGHS